MADAKVTQGFVQALTRLDADAKITQGFVQVLQSLVEEEPENPEPLDKLRRVAVWFN